LKLREFPLLTDENVDRDVVASLRGLGFDVVDVVESGRAGATDVDLLRWATSQGRVVVTMIPTSGRWPSFRTSHWSDCYFSDPGISTRNSRSRRFRHC
jgi:hypothetical protein